MLVYGVSVAFGNIWGGKLADKQGPVRALKQIFLLLALVLLLLTFTAPHPVLVVITVLLWGASPSGTWLVASVCGAASGALHAPRRGRGLGPEYRRF